MKHFLSGCVLIALSFAALAEVDPSERYLEAYFLIQEADEATAASTWAAADAKFSAALQVLNAIQSESPSWHASLVQFRIKYCNDRLTELRPKLPVASPVTPPAEVDQVRQLQAELQAARENARKLEETRDKLAGELQAKLKEPAPSDRQSARQTLDQLHALQAVNDALTAQLEAARQRADRADQIEKQLQQSQERIRGLEGERTGLNAKLQDALGKLSATQPSPQLEALMKKNAELTEQLASTQAQITQMRDEMATTGGDSSAETVKLRAQVAPAFTQHCPLVLVVGTVRAGKATLHPPSEHRHSRAGSLAPDFSL